MWVAVPRDGWTKEEEEEEGGRALWRPGKREDLPANGVKHCVIQATVGEGVGKRAKRWRGEGEVKYELGVVLVDHKERVGKRWRADRCYSPGPRHRKSFKLWSACCLFPLSTHQQSRSYTYPTLDEPRQLPLTDRIWQRDTFIWLYNTRHYTIHTAFLMRPCCTVPSVSRDQVTVPLHRQITYSVVQEWLFGSGTVIYANTNTESQLCNIYYSTST